MRRTGHVTHEMSRDGGLVNIPVTDYNSTSYFTLAVSLVATVDELIDTSVEWSASCHVASPLLVINYVHPTHSIHSTTRTTMMFAITWN